jgi:hypothetical protein
MITPSKNTSDDPTQKAMSGMVIYLSCHHYTHIAESPGCAATVLTVSTLVALFQQYLVMFKEVSLFEHLGIRKKKDE